MAISQNLVTKGLTGSVGKTLVFKTVNGKTIVSASPVKGSKEPSEKQLEQRKRFKLASLYAARVIANSELLLEYTEAAQRKGITNVRSLIMADYFHAPEIMDYEISTTPTDSLNCVVADLVRVKSVTMKIMTPDGEVLESGNATMSVDLQTWSFLISDVAHLQNPFSIEISATDLAGNVSTKTFEQAL